MAKSQLRTNKEKKKPKQVKTKGAPASPFMPPAIKTSGSADGKK